MQQLPVRTFALGLRQDLHPDALPEGAILLSDNMSLFKGDIGLVPGYLQFVPGQTPLAGTYILHVDEILLEAGPITLLVATDTKIYKYDGIGFVDISGMAYTATIDFPWQVGIEGNPAGDIFTIWADDSRDPVQKWDGTAATFTNLAGSPFDAGKHFSRVATDFQNHLMHLNRTEGGVHKPRMLRWSDNGVPEVYGGGEAGFLILFQGSDWGVTLEPLSVYMAAYRERSIHLVTYVGSPFFMSQRQVIDGVGLVAPRALINLDNQHIFLGNDNVYVFNGADLTAIGDAIRDDLFGRLDPKYLTRCQMLFDELRNDVIVVIPTKTSPEGVPDTWYYYNLPTQAWSGPRQGRPCYGSGNWQRTTGSRWVDMPAGLAWNEMAGSWQRLRVVESTPSILFGNTTRIVYAISTAIVTEDGVSITGRVETGAYNPGRIIYQPFVDETTCTRIRPIGDDVTNNSIAWYIGRANAVDGNYTWEGPYFAGVRGFVNTKPVTSRWFRFAVQATGINRVAGFVADFEAAG